MSKSVDMMLLKEMETNDDDEIMIGFELDDGELLDQMMETQSVHEAMLEIFPPEDKFTEVEQNDRI